MKVVTRRCFTDVEYLRSARSGMDREGGHRCWGASTSVNGLGTNRSPLYVSSAWPAWLGDSSRGSLKRVEVQEMYKDTEDGLGRLIEEPRTVQILVRKAQSWSTARHDIVLHVQHPNAILSPNGIYPIPRPNAADACQGFANDITLQARDELHSSSSVRFSGTLSLCCRTNSPSS